MTFYIQGLNAFELVPLNQVFKEAIVEETAAIRPDARIGKNEHHGAAGHPADHQKFASAYQSVVASERNDVLAEQIMSQDVVTLTSHARVSDTLALFQKKQIRHLPVVSSEALLIGMVSERDVLRYLSGLPGGHPHSLVQGANEPVTAFMNSPVLTASMDTDIRYISRLFVEQRIGALPVVSAGEIKGIITRSDVLKAVMRHLVLTLWA